MRLNREEQRMIKNLLFAISAATVDHSLPNQIWLLAGKLTGKCSLLPRVPKRISCTCAICGPSAENRTCQQLSGGLGGGCRTDTEHVAELSHLPTTWNKIWEPYESVL